MIYDVDYFIAKFTNTRDDKWCTNNYHYDGKSCAMGWCGVDEYISRDKFPIEAIALMSILGRAGLFAEMINDANYADYQQGTPKERMLAALRDIKNGKSVEDGITPEYDDITSELASKPIQQEVPDIKIREVITH